MKNKRVLFGNLSLTFTARKRCSDVIASQKAHAESDIIKPPKEKKNIKIIFINLLEMPLTRKNPHFSVSTPIGAGLAV